MYQNGAFAMMKSIFVPSLILCLFVGCGESPVAPDAPVRKDLATTNRTASNHGDFGESSGVYRIPYANGTSVFVTNDAHNHNNRYDLCALPNCLDPAGPKVIVAAASGWIRGIVENHGNSPGAGDGMDAMGNPWPDPAHGDSLEHACVSNDSTDTVPGGPSACTNYNNYVWIEHPNGEYTNYSHMGTGTVSGNGWSVGAWINAGEMLGLENDIGFASCGNCDPSDPASHLHFEVAFPNNPGDALTWTALGGFVSNGTRVPPVVCDIPDNELLAGETYTANPCQHDPPTADAGGPYSVDEGSQVVLDGTASSDPDGNPLTYLWEPDSDPTDPWFLDDHSIAEPTFEANDNMIVNLTLNVYDQVEALADDDATSVTVSNVAPTVDAGPDQSITSNDDFNFSGNFSDPGVVDDPWDYSIDWGDGNPSSDGSTNSQASSITDSHQYCAAGPYTVSLTVTDKDGGTGMDDLLLTVEFLAIGIDIKPGGAPNPVNLKSKGLVPVAILSTDDFDATAIDPATLTLGDDVNPDTPVATKPNGTYHTSVEDVNDDGLSDLVVKFRVPELVANGDLTVATTSLVLQGFLEDNCTNFLGMDDVKVVP